MLFYTGAIQYEDAQNNPLLSQGGYKSSTQIPNGELNNIFPKITRAAVIGKKRAVRMIVFENITGSSITNLRIWSEDGNHSKIEMAFIQPGKDRCDKPIFEKVINDNLPYQGTFQAYSETEPYTLANLDAGQSFGIWLKRDLKQESFSDYEKNDLDLSCEVMIENKDSLFAESADEDKVKLHFLWD